jgi:tetratricopeptide (TPR) repeat protein
MWDLIKQALTKYLLAPFSNKVTRALLIAGSSLLAFPTIKYIVFDVVAKYLFKVDVGLTYRTGSLLMAGVIILAMAVLHNVYVTHNENTHPKCDLKIGEISIKGNFSIEEVKDLIHTAPVSGNRVLDYSGLREKYQPIISEAVRRIDQGNLDKGRELLQSVLKDMPLGIIATAYLNYGYYCSSSGKEGDAEYYQVALRIYKDMGYKEGLSTVYRNLGESARRKHDFDQAEHYQKEAISVSEQLEDKVGLADAIGNLGLVYAQQCRHKEAEAEFEKSIAIYEKLHAVSQIKRIKSYIDTMRTCPNY